MEVYFFNGAKWINIGDMAKRSGKKQVQKRRPQQKKLRKKQSDRAKILGLIGGLTFIVLALVIAVTIYKSRSASGPIKVTGDFEVISLLDGIPQQGNVLGQPNAPVTLIEFADLKCPVCQKFSTSGLNQIINDYVRTGKLRIVFQLQTFVGRQKAPGDSERGARFAIAAGQQNKLWSFTELFYHNQRPEDQKYVSDDFLSALGNAIPGLNVQQAFAEMDSGKITEELNGQISAFQSAGFKGVPSFQIGKTGAMPTNLPTPSLDYSTFSTAIDKLL